MPKGAHPKPPKLTAQEVMSLHGLTVEQAIAKGYDVALAEKKPPGSGNSVGGKRK